MAPGSGLGDENELLLLRLRRLRRLRRRPRPRRSVIALVVVLGALGALGAAGAVLAVSTFRSECSTIRLEPLRLGENSFVYAADRSLTGAVPSEKNRRRLPLARISPWLPKATVAIEDRRFWHHGAIDYKAIVRAAVANFRAGRIVQGGSTITQQLVRNLYAGTEGLTLRRKVAEACAAMELERRWSKQRVLEEYLNHVFYGSRAYGAEAAARTYFGRPARDLTLPQAALLAGLPQAPSQYDPMRRPDAALARRNDVLRAMLLNRDITAAQYRWAASRPLRLEPGRLYRTIKHRVFFGYALRELRRAFPDAVRSGGLRVETTLDPRLQRLATLAIIGRLPDGDDPAAAVVAIDPRTGAIRAMAARAGARKLHFNLAWQGRRQAGSAFKPFTLAAALEHGISLNSVRSGPSALTVYDDRCDGPEGDWEVHNYADASGGTMDLVSATANSVNTIYAQLVTEVGPPRTAAMARRLGIRSALSPVCSVTLGSQAVSPLEMTTAYATLAARGVRRGPHAIRLVRGPDGRELFRLRDKGVRAVSEKVADQVTYALQHVVTSGTGTGASIGRPVAGKTGTAEEYVDAWFCGYVPQLATCVWVGYPKAEIPLLNVGGYYQVTGGSIPAAIWRDFMLGALEGAPELEFPTPEEFGPVTYVSNSYSSSSSSSYSSSDDEEEAEEAEEAPPAAPAAKPAPAPKPVQAAAKPKPGPKPAPQPAPAVEAPPPIVTRTTPSRRFEPPAEREPEAEPPAVQQ